MAVFNVTYNQDFDIYDRDLELIRNEVAKGKDFDDIFYEVTAGYDDNVFYNRNLFKEQVKEYIETLPRTDTYSLNLEICNLTKEQAEHLKKTAEGHGRFSFSHLDVAKLEIKNKENK